LALLEKKLVKGHHDVLEATRNPDVVAMSGGARLVPLPPASPTDLSTRSTQTIDDLLRRMQAGDRAAAAEFLLRYESRLRRRIRGKLAIDVRRLFDSLDIVSTLGRRLDLYVMSGQLKARNELECLSLLFKMADRALIDKARLFRQLESVEGEDGDLAYHLAARLREAQRRSQAALDLEIEQCMEALGSPLERRILSLWLTGETLTSIAQCVQLSSSAISRRWMTIKDALRRHLLGIMDSKS
jgi:hypothetical protein